MNNNYTDKSYLVVGCGGLGCYLVEGLLRLGVRKITVCDPDVFSESNLNRQLYSTKENLGEFKVKVAESKAKKLGYKGEFTAYPTLFEDKMLEGTDIVFDALDNIADRLKLEDCCASKNIPIIHGAVEGNIYQIGICLPGKNLLHRIYEGAKDTKKKQTNVITVQMCTAKQLSLITGEFVEYYEMEDITPEYDFSQL